MDVDNVPPNAQLHDSFLLSVKQTNDSLRAQTMSLLDLISKNPQGIPPQSVDRNSPDSSLTPESKEILKANKNLSVLLSILRGQNRRLALLARDTKSETSSSRGEVDHLHLSLQNLYYEQRHLMSEIASCQNYPHPYASLPMISEQDFLHSFPDWNDKRDQQDQEDAGEQGLMRARIQHEGKQRQDLQHMVKTLSEKKLGLSKENDKRKQELVKLDKDLEAFIEVSSTSLVDQMRTYTGTGCETHPENIRKGVLTPLLFSKAFCALPLESGIFTFNQVNTVGKEWTGPSTLPLVRTWAH